MSNLLPRSSESLLAARIPDSFSRPEGRALMRMQNREVAEGLVAATRVQAAGFVAGVGLHGVAMLSRQAQLQADGDPIVANRLNFIVDMYASAVANELSRFGR